LNSRQATARQAASRRATRAHALRLDGRAHTPPEGPLPKVALPHVAWMPRSLGTSRRRTVVRLPRRPSAVSWYLCPSGASLLSAGHEPARVSAIKGSNALTGASAVPTARPTRAPPPPASPPQPTVPNRPLASPRAAATAGCYALAAASPETATAAATPPWPPASRPPGPLHPVQPIKSKPRAPLDPSPSFPGQDPRRAHRNWPNRAGHRA
jgi:hypothetical protein